MKKTTFLIAFLSCLSFAFPLSFVKAQSTANAQENTQQTAVNLANDPRVAYLKNKSLKIRSINPSNDDFSDLMPLKKVIGDAQVVMLGEGTHHDANTYRARTRLIKFLHQEMGFDVLAFESGFYDVSRAWQNIQAGKDADSEFYNSVFFGGLVEFYPLIEYIQGQVKTKKPLEITGFDSQLTGTPTRDTLVSDLREFFKEVGIQTNALDEGSPFAKQLVLQGMLGGYTPPDQAFIDTFVDLRKQVASKVTNPKSPKIAYMLQLLESIETNARNWRLGAEAKEKKYTVEQQIKLGMHDMRDKQMARNLIWLAQVRYPKRKIIASAASVHTGYSDIFINDPYFKKKWRNVELPLMGYYVRQALGSKVYSISFTYYEGMAGTITNYPESTWKIETNQRPEIELEELFHSTRMEYAFLDLRNPRKGGEWLKGRFVSRVGGGNGAMEGKWNTYLDGIIYIREGKAVEGRRKNIPPIPYIKAPPK